MTGIGAVATAGVERCGAREGRRPRAATSSGGGGQRPAGTLGLGLGEGKARGSGGCWEGGWCGGGVLQKIVDCGFEYKNLKDLFAKKQRSGMDRPSATDQTVRVGLSLHGTTRVVSGTLVCSQLSLSTVYSIKSIRVGNAS